MIVYVCVVWKGVSIYGKLELKSCSRDKYEDDWRYMVVIVFQVKSPSVAKYSNFFGLASTFVLNLSKAFLSFLFKSFFLSLLHCKFIIVCFTVVACSDVKLIL